MLFLYSLPKRKSFVFRYALSVIICLAVGVFIPNKIDVSIEALASLYVFIRYISLFALTVAAMYVCFDMKFFSLFSACSAGYAVQHASSRLLISIGSIFDLWSFVSQCGDLGVIVLEFIFFPIPYMVSYFVFGRYVAKNKLYENSGWFQNVLSIVMVIICIGLSRFSSNISRHLYAVSMCIFALLVQITLQRASKLREENAVTQSILQQERKRYEINKENIDLINIKCHDLKYRLASYGGHLPQDEIDSIMRAVNLYDTAFKTDNEVLDVVLSEKSIKCDSLEIRLSCMANGKALDFMEAGDIYSLVGNALDNAIEAVGRIEDKEKRTVSVTVEGKGEVSFLHITNYFREKPIMVDGEPLTTKGNNGYHGFGFKSMKLIAEKYHGNIGVTVDDETFTLSVWLTRP